MRSKRIEASFLWITLALLCVGFFIFISASLGLLARDNITPGAVITSQIISLALGLGALVITSRIKYTFWNKYAFYIFIGSLILTALVFIPALGFAHGGAQRWLSLGPFSFQPAEVLKFGFVIYWAAWMAGVRKKVETVKWGVSPMLILLAIVGGLLILQPDMGTFLVIGVTAAAMFIAGGGKWTHTVSLGALGAVLLAGVGFLVPYIRARMVTFLNPASDPLGAGYQIQQSLIAIGSGEWWGRGFGQSVQKFNFLPEPIGDSIFAVFAEEWGFIGVVALIALFTVFALKGFKIAVKAPTAFSRTTVVGIITLIVAQSFINMASMLGLFPLTGMPLLFVSQGGSALIVALAEVGVVLGISKYGRQEVGK